MTEYCLKKNWPNVCVSTNKLRVCFAILIVSGYHSLPSTCIYWFYDPDVHNKTISKAMRQDRFDTIKKCLHFNTTDNFDKEDKYWKLCPLISYLQKRFMDHFIPSQNISHDEAIVKYFGKHSCKQSVRNKPIRFGYKVWRQNTPSGYLLAFDPYQRKTYKGNEDIEKKFGKAASTVLYRLEDYSEDKKYLAYHFIFDNYFTSVPLLTELSGKGYNGTGTIRSNRLDKSCPVSSVEMINKKERGYHSSATGIVEASEVTVSRWKDNAVVTVASTLLGKSPVGKVKQ
ncbi:piggyBac transposable element-derived protein 3-like [Palaemon carinicauda]|uniref:piggyBac transposable element-derived protein 3-like n=1 Tax=Palaemon carinicauda TaxID=392227 RepID=UPI0035B6070D